MIRIQFCLGTMVLCLKQEIEHGTCSDCRGGSLGNSFSATTPQISWYSFVVVQRKSNNTSIVQATQPIQKSKGGEK